MLAVVLVLSFIGGFFIKNAWDMRKVRKAKEPQKIESGPPDTRELVRRIERKQETDWLAIYKAYVDPAPYVVGPACACETHNAFDGVGRVFDMSRCPEHKDWKEYP